MIDLRRGHAVHARGGERAHYRDVAHAGDVRIDGDPLALARYYRDEYGLSDLYIADLDAIGGDPLQAAVIRDITAVDMDVWLDAGTATPADAGEAAGIGSSTVVIGLETLPDYAALERLGAGPTSVPLALSLDVRDGQPVCRAGCDIAGDSAERVARRASDAGIGTIVVLDLAHVGGEAGPAFDVIARVQAAVPGVSVLAGGGVRSDADMRELNAMGVAGVLIATALQRKAVTAAAVHSILMR